MRRSQEESIALLDGLHENDGATIPHISRLQPPPPKPLLWFTYIFSGFVVLQIAIYLHIAQILIRPSDVGTGILELRNPYIGLEELYRVGEVTPGSYEPIVNIARIAAQVTSAEPNEVFPEDEHHSLTNAGTMSPLDRHLRVSNDTHTIVQFRALDFGMERCALALRLPPRDADKSVLSEPFELHDVSGKARLDVCALDTSQPLNTRSLSWVTRPRCSKHVGTFTVGAGDEVRLPDFSCKWASLHTYEISCAATAVNCRIDVWSNHNASWGILLYQFQTM